MGSEERKECPSARVFLNVKTGEEIRGGCHAWACPVCGPKRQAELSLRIRVAMRAQLAEYGGHLQFLTLTLDPSRNEESRANGTKAQALYVSRCWRRLVSKWRERCRRQGWRPPQYVKVAEWRDRSAAMHLHILFLGWIPSDRELKGDIESAGFGKVFDISRVKSVRKVARYVASYVTKTARVKAPRYVHRYTANRETLPVLALWRRIIRLGMKDDLRAAAEGQVFALMEGACTWWKGAARAVLEKKLDELEAAAGFGRGQLHYLGQAGGGRRRWGARSRPTGTRIGPPRVP